MTTRTTLQTLFAAVCALALVACGGSSKTTKKEPNLLDSIPEPEPESELPELAADKQKPAEPEKPAKPEKPAAPEYEYSHGAFVWYELSTGNPKKALDFYTKLFGWETSKGEIGGEKYDVIKNGGREIGLVMKGNPKLKLPTQWTLYLSVASVKEGLLNAKANGGSVVMEPTDVPDIGRFALVADADGAIFALFKSAKGDQFDRAEGSGDWDWNELWAKRPADATQLYEAVADYSSEQVTYGKEVTYRLIADEVTRGCVGDAPKGQSPKWIPFVRVDDLDASFAKARKLKAKVRRKPYVIYGVGRAAVLSDPTGATFGMIERKAAEEPEK